MRSGQDERGAFRGGDKGETDERRKTTRNRVHSRVETAEPCMSARICTRACIRMTGTRRRRRWAKVGRKRIERRDERERERERATERPSEREREKRRGTKPESTKLETHYEFAPPMLFDEPPTNRILAYRNRACTVNLGIASKYSRSPIATVWRLDVLLRRWVGVSGSVCGGRGGSKGWRAVRFLVYRRASYESTDGPFPIAEDR